MIFAGIDVDIITHEKALASGVEAMGLWLWGMCWTQKHTTDGRLPRVAVLGALGGRRNILLAKRLVASGLWLDREDGGWDVWNYNTKNQTADEIKAKRAKTAERVKQWRERRGNGPVTRYGGPDVTRYESVRTDPQTQSPSPPDNTTRHQGIGTASPPAEPAAPKSRRKPETPCPSSDASASEIRDWCENWKIPDGHGEFQAFLDHHRKADARWRDWAAAWRTWLRNASRFGARGGAARGAEITKQPFDPNAPWMKLPEVG